MSLAGSPPSNSKISNVNATLLASGNASFPAGTYGINIAHGLPYTPVAADVTITPKGAYPAPKSIGLNSIDGTNIALGTNDNGSGAEVWWRVGIFGNR